MIDELWDAIQTERIAKPDYTGQRADGGSSRSIKKYQFQFLREKDSMLMCIEQMWSRDQ